jgi:excisionase family DNA binding protein
MRSGADEGMKGGEMTDRLLLRPEEVAELIGVGRTKVYELIGSGLIRSVKIGNSRRVPRIAVDEFVATLQSDIGE